MYIRNYNQEAQLNEQKNAYYNKMITNTNKQTVTIINGNPYVIYTNPGIISKKIDELIESFLILS